MRSSPVAPVPVLTDNTKSFVPTTVSSPTSKSTSRSTSKSISSVNKKAIPRKIVSDNVSPRRHKSTQPQFLTTTKQFGNSPYQSSGNPHVFRTLDSDSPTLASSSISMEDDNSGDSNHITDDVYKNDISYHPYHVPFVDRNHIDDISHGSTDDPYTYSDDSASLSDAYFLQQPSPEYCNLNGGLLGLLPHASSDEEQKDSFSKDSKVWAGPQSIQLDEKLSPTTGSRRRDNPTLPTATIRTSKRYTERDQRRYRRQRHQERNVSSSSSAIEKDAPINENTSLLDDKSSLKVRHCDREGYKEQNRKFAEAKNTNASITKSYIHQQHRKKHQLRKYKRNIMLQEQQKRQEERERAVSEVRGQPQPLAMRRNRFWLVLFILQLLLVCSIAIKYGLTFYRPSTLLSASDENESIAMSSMLYPSIDNEDPIVESESIDRPVSTLEFGDDRDHDTDKLGLAANTEDKAFTIDYKNVLSLLLISGTYSCIISYLSFAFMLILARSIIPIMLVFTIIFLLCLGFFGLMVDTYVGSIISLCGFTLFGMSFVYTMSNWNQIPFCSTNFHTAICAMRSSIGILFMGISSLFVALLWLLIWAIALMGTFNRNNSTDCEMLEECETHVYIYRGRIIELALLLVSLYWTILVIKNIIRVAVAGAIGGPWWFAIVHGDGEEGEQETFDRCCGCWSKSVVSDPLVRACTCSLGTICFGSLVELPAQLLSKIVICLCWLTGSSSDDLNSDSTSERTQMVAKISLIRKGGTDNDEDEEKGDDRNTREGTNATDSTIPRKVMPLQSRKQESNTAVPYFGILKMNLQRLDHTLQSCNRWSYTYIGMYNYSFYQGGEKAIQLFETREWMDIARDRLIQNTLFMASIVIGGSSGMVAMLVEEVDGYEFTSLHKPIMTSFLIGFFLGFILSNILLLGLAASAVNTVLVCFAAEPFAFDRNHPHLSREMREVWSQQVWEPDASGG